MANIKTTVIEYRNKKLEYGVYDCNLMILKIYFPEYYSEIKGTYKSVFDGVAMARKLFGFRSLKHLIESNRKFKMITERDLSNGDLIIMRRGNDAAICLGSKCFGVVSNEFKTFDFSDLDKDKYILFKGV